MSLVHLIKYQIPSLSSVLVIDLKLDSPLIINSLKWECHIKLWLTVALPFSCPDPFFTFIYLML